MELLLGLVPERGGRLDAIVEERAPRGWAVRPRRAVPRRAGVAEAGHAG